MYFKIIFLLSVIQFLCRGEEISFEFELGKIKGKILKSQSAENFFAFRGIRYAQPPIGNFRFEPPQPIQPWGDKEFDATIDGPVCPQPLESWDIVSEDCLRLNIYSKNMTGSSPVIMFIHPGGFYEFFGASHGFGAEYLMNHNVVLVTINYRLGSLGFMSTGTKECPGNNGFKDQVMALKFIQNYIKNFGGNPKNVTIMGYSAGGMSGTLHLVSPMSQNLFHKVITLSSTATAQWKIPTNQFDLFKRQAILLNITDQSIDVILKKMKEVDVKKFAETQSNMFDMKNGNPVLLWYPIIEQNFGQERFLIEDPSETIERGDFEKVPIIVGITKDEFLGISDHLMNNDRERQKINENWNDLAPIYVLYERNTSNSNYISKKFHEHYINGSQLSNDQNSIENFGRLFSDGTVRYGVYRFVKLVSKFTDVYFYRFNYQGRYSFVMKNNEPIGVVHHDDLLYMFYMPLFAPFVKETDKEFRIMKIMTELMVNFATNGNPNNHASISIGNITWKTVPKLSSNYLNIGEEIKMVNENISPDMQLWDELFHKNY